ncbi:uncharacterized protein LOC144712837 isoform X2 [Wolffia australiana]
MSRTSFRPRPLDIHKKLAIVKSIKDFEDDDLVTTTVTRNSQLQRFVAEAENEVPPAPRKKNVSEIPTPEFLVVDSYERCYPRTFNQTPSYIRARGARAELGEFIEYDLDDEDEDWLHDFNDERNLLSDEMFESLLFKFEVMDHKARERAGVITSTFGSPIPILLQLDAVVEALQSQSIKYAVFQSVYNYWKKKRERWQKPILRRLQPPPPASDSNPYNVFRTREKAYRLHTRRRRENNVQSFERLRIVRRNIEQAKTVLEALIKREERKKDSAENEVALQRLQMKFRNEAQVIEDGVALTEFRLHSSNLVLSEDEFVDSDDMMNGRPRGRPVKGQNSLPLPPGRMKRDLKRRSRAPRWLQKIGPVREPVMLFTKPVDAEKLVAAGIGLPQCQFFGRMGRGGRIIFDRTNL